MKDLSFHYKDGVGIEIPTLSIPKGAIVGIIGENGAGKTTFARCLCGLENRQEVYSRSEVKHTATGSGGKSAIWLCRMSIINFLQKALKMKSP